MTKQVSVFHKTGQEMGGTVNGYCTMEDLFPRLVTEEIQKAREKYPPIHSIHEGLAIIQEEFEEFKAEVFKQSPSKLRMLKEIVQVAAMAERIASDCGLDELTEEETEQWRLQ